MSEQGRNRVDRFHAFIRRGNKGDDHGGHEFGKVDSSGGHGRLFRSDGKPWESSTEWNQNAMRLAGITCDRASLAMILETPYDAVSQMADDGAGRISHRLVQNASLGELRYARVITLAPMAVPGYVAMSALTEE